MKMVTDQLNHSSFPRAPIMPSPFLIELLRCPETMQKVRLLTSEEMADLNQRLQISWTAGLIREDERRIFPIQDDIPLMLLDAAVAVA